MARFEGVDFAQNHAGFGGAGGAAWAQRSTAVFKDCTLRGNTVWSSYVSRGQGGAVGELFGGGVRLRGWL
jgi:hypothetical protein